MILDYTDPIENEEENLSCDTYDLEQILAEELKD